MQVTVNKKPWALIIKNLLPTFFGVTAKNFHVIVSAAADDKFRLVPVAT